jgi:hypothetical protein
VDEKREQRADRHTGETAARALDGAALKRA